MRLDVLVACFYMHARRVVSRLDAKEHQPLSGYALYESLFTYVAQSGSPIVLFIQRENTL